MKTHLTLAQRVHNAGLSQEAENGTVAIRYRDSGENVTMTLEEFIAKVSKLIVAEKARMIVSHIEYHKLDERYDSDIFTDRMPENMSKALSVSRCSASGAS